MTPRQRVLAVLHKQPVDHVPFTVYESKIPQCAVERRLRNEGMCIVHRNVSAIVGRTPNCVGRSYTYTENGRQRIRDEVQTPAGTLVTVNEPAGFTSWTLEKFFKGPEDYKALLAMAKDTHYAPNYEAFAAAERWMGEDVILRGGVGGFPLHMIMIHYMGVEEFAIEWMERRDEILKLEKAMADSLRQVFPLLADSPITHANFGGNETPEVMGPARYREFCLPLVAECAEHFHRKGKLLGSHMDANNKAWAADIAASGFDYIEAFTPAPGTDMSLAEALAAWPDKVLWINFPSVVHLSDLQTIGRTARELIQAAAGTNRLIMGITEDVPPDRWQENFLAISEVINECR
jgi:hypothetical protein